MHHLKIMESLGGDLEWGDRFFAQHAAFFYYWVPLKANPWRLYNVLYYQDFRSPFLSKSYH